MNKAANARVAWCMLLLPQTVTSIFLFMQFSALHLLSDSAKPKSINFFHEKVTFTQNKRTEKEIQQEKEGEMDTETRNKIEETVLEILKESNMDEATEHKIRKAASDKLGMDLSEPTRKKFVRKVVESYLTEQQAKAEEEEGKQEEEEEEEEEEEDDRKRGGKEYDDEGGLIVCRLSDKRRVTLSEFRGKTLVSMREYYKKDGKELPTAKGISLSPEQWATFSKNVPAIEKAIKKMESRRT